MNAIEQEDKTWNLKIEADQSYFCGEWYLDLSQGRDNLKLTKDGAKELISVLQEFIDA